VGVQASQWWVSWVLFASNISSMNCAIGLLQYVVDALEEKINLSIPASARPPTLDNSDVVAIDSVVSSLWGNLGDVLDQELEANGFHPSNVPSFAFPPRYKPPCPPVFSNRDSDAETRAGIRVCMEVNDGCGLWNWP
jgi:hypothetical protein